MVTARPATLRDVDRILVIEQASSQNPWTRDGIVSSLSNQNSVFWVLESQENSIIGFACSTLILDELHILEVAVDSCYRNMGLGALLMSRLIQTAAAKKARRAYLEVRRSNLPAIRLYEKSGFTVELIKAKYYGDGEDAVFMENTSMSERVFREINNDLVCQSGYLPINQII